MISFQAAQNPSGDITPDGFVHSPKKRPPQSSATRIAHPLLCRGIAFQTEQISAILQLDAPAKPGDSR
jgi:hypothetical protein